PTRLCSVLLAALSSAGLPSSRFCVVVGSWGMSRRKHTIPSRVKRFAIPGPGGGIFHQPWRIYANRYRQVVQRPEGLWLHSAGGWRQRRFRSHLRVGALRPRQLERGPKGQIRGGDSKSTDVQSAYVLGPPLFDASSRYR